MRWAHALPLRWRSRDFSGMCNCAICAMGGKPANPHGKPHKAICQEATCKTCLPACRPAGLPACLPACVPGVMLQCSKPGGWWAGGLVAGGWWLVGLRAQIEGGGRALR